MAMKPIVDGFEKKDKARLEMIRVNDQSTTDCTLALLHVSHYPRAFLLFDAREF